MSIEFGMNNNVVSYLKAFIQDHFNIVLSSSYYDKLLHFYIGKYLRELKTEKNLDLLCMYNLIDNTLIENYALKRIDNTKSIKLIQTKNNEFYDLIPVMIKPNIDYTLFLNSEDYEILLSPVGFDGKNFVTTTPFYQFSQVQRKVLSSNSKDELFSESITYRFNHPDYQNDNNIKNLVDSDYLYLLIQVPKKCKNRVVLEGNYSFHSFKKEEDIFFFEYSSPKRSIDYIKKNSKFLFSLDGFISDKTVAFDSELLEYLYNNAITHLSSEDNIFYFQQLLSSHSFKSAYKTEFFDYSPGIFNESMRNWIMNFQSKFTSSHFKLGYIDKETEQMIMKVTT